MNPLDFFKDLISKFAPQQQLPVNKFLSPLPARQTGFPIGTNKNINNFIPDKPKTILASSSKQSNLKGSIMQGFEAFAGGKDLPIQDFIPELVEAGKGLPEPLLPAILALMETGGLQNAVTPNNVFNIGPGINYPSPAVAITGGGPDKQLGLKGLLRKGGLYDDYLRSGNLDDFFNRFTPPGEEFGNPSLEQLKQRFNSLKQLFE